jgi:YidC/Oxa1 family membrane protein insertase
MLVTANVFGPLIDVFESVLKFFHNSGGISWGLSIVLLTIAVRALLIPLTFRQIKSMVRMQSLAPQMKESQAKYKEDKQRQQQEIMKFYKANNVNPLGSCLPLVLQLPVFVSLYYMLKKNLRFDICPGRQTAFREAYAKQHNISLAAAHSQTTYCGTHAAGAHFLFIHDLTAKATGVELGILIVLYVGSQLGSSLLMSAATMDPTQRKVMLFMPLIFVLFVIRFPAGLLLYWITTNLWTVIQQYTVRRYIGPTVAVVPGGGNGAAVIDSPSRGSLTGGSGGGGNGSGGGGGSGGSGVGGGGLATRLRDRLAAVQSGGQAAPPAKTGKPGPAESGNGAGSSSKVSSGSRGRSQNGKSSGASGGTGDAEAGSSSRLSPAKRRRGASNEGSGNGNGSSGASTTGGNGARAGAPPPRPPRKKKKRSGRRR